MPDDHEYLVEDTFPKLLRRNAQILAGGPRCAKRIWAFGRLGPGVKSRTGSAHWRSVCGARGDLRDRVAIVGENRPRLYWSMCAAQLLGAIPVPMYQDLVAQEMTFLFRHAAARVAIVENQEQVDKPLSRSGNPASTFATSSMTMHAG